MIGTFEIILLLLLVLIGTLIIAKVSWQSWLGLFIKGALWLRLLYFAIMLIFGWVAYQVIMMVWEMSAMPEM